MSSQNSFAWLKKKRSSSLGTESLLEFWWGSRPTTSGSTIAWRMIRDSWSGSPKHGEACSIEKAFASRTSSSPQFFFGDFFSLFPLSDDCFVSLDCDSDFDSDFDSLLDS